MHPFCLKNKHCTDYEQAAVLLVAQGGNKERA